MILSDAWYASGMLWAAAGVVVAILAGVAGVWVTWRVGNPRRSLDVLMPSATPLLRDAGGGTSSLEVRHREVVLADPHLVQVRVINSGRFDIPSTAFDGGRPLRIELSAPIVEVLSGGTCPSTAALPPLAVDGSTLLVRPALIARGQRVSLDVLVDGRPVLS